MEIENKKEPWLRCDYRVESLYQIIAGLDISIKTLEKRMKKMARMTDFGSERTVNQFMV